MAVEDIPPRGPTGLGERLSDILARQAAGAYETYEETLFGGEGAATPEEVSESLSSVYEKAAPPPLPPPSEVLIVNQAYGAKVVVRKTSRAGLTWKRPDLDVTAYEQGAGLRSTRVWGIQWIPTAMRMDLTFAEVSGDYKGFELNQPALFGDILVAFARPSNVQANSLYVYKHNPVFTWEAFRSSNSFGKFINRLNGGVPYNSSDGLYYGSLHPTVGDGEWIFGTSYMGMWSTTREVSASGAGLSTGFIEEFIEGFFGDKKD